MKTIITYGTYDIFHVGHVKLLKRARELGERLVVGISTDEFNELKGKKSIFSYEERAEIVSSVRFVDEVFPENSWEQKVSDIKKYGADALVMGGDWEGKFDELRNIVDVIYLPRTPLISTTEVKKSIRDISDAQIDAMRASVDVISTILDGLK